MKMKNTFLIGVLIIFSPNVFSQQLDSLNLSVSTVDSQYIGGDSALSCFIKRNLWYPPQERDAGIQGTVIIGFTINEDRTLTDFFVNKVLVQH